MKLRLRDTTALSVVTVSIVEKNISSTMMAIMFIGSALIMQRI